MVAYIAKCSMPLGPRPEPCGTADTTEVVVDEASSATNYIFSIVVFDYKQ